MSCFNVANETITRIANFMAPSMGLEPYKLAKRLRTMNNSAFRYRYEGRHRKDIPKFVYIENVEPCSDIQLHKSMTCYLYQCSEGSIVRRKLFSQVEEALKKLTKKIIEDSGHLFKFLNSGKGIENYVSDFLEWKDANWE